MNIVTPLQIGSLTIPHRLIQGPLAGYSCAPFRAMYDLFQQPAYSVSEMISAHDLLYRQPARFVARAPQERVLCYQLSGDKPEIIAQAASYLESIGADLIDLNCGCPKPKIRKKGAGSALLEQPERLVRIVAAVKARVQIPVTVKIRIQGNENDCLLVQEIANAGADAVIVHGRRWQDDYDIPCNIQHIATIKKASIIPVIANGDIHDKASLQRLVIESGCDAYMISRAGTGRPWLYQQLLQTEAVAQSDLSYARCIDYFMLHLQGLSHLLHNEYQTILHSKSLVKHYFRPWFQPENLRDYYQLDDLTKIEEYLRSFIRISDYES